MDEGNGLRPAHRQGRTLRAGAAAFCGRSSGRTVISTSSEHTKLCSTFECRRREVFADTPFAHYICFLQRRFRVSVLPALQLSCTDNHIVVGRSQEWSMSSITISLIVFACVFGGAVFGILFRAALPEHHLSADSKDVVKLGMGLVATMAALVLGLLVSSAKGSYDTQSSEVTEMSAKIVFLDRILAHYGPETKEARDALRSAVVGSVDLIWPQERERTSEGKPPSTHAETLLDKIQILAPKDDKQRWIQSEALSEAVALGQTRWLLYEQGASSVSWPMITILVFWLTAIFVSFGLFAPGNQQLRPRCSSPLYPCPAQSS